MCHSVRNTKLSFFRVGIHAGGDSHERGGPSGRLGRASASLRGATHCFSVECVIESLAITPMLVFQIEYTGPAKVGAYFKVFELGQMESQAPCKLQPGQLESAFRGRKLIGKVVSLPSGYSGAVLQDTKEGSIGETEDRRWLQKRRFEKLTYWQQDDAPQEDEPFIKCMRIVDLAEVLHGDHSPKVES